MHISLTIYTLWLFFTAASSIRCDFESECAALTNVIDEEFSDDWKTVKAKNNKVSRSLTPWCDINSPYTCNDFISVTMSKLSKVLYSSQGTRISTESNLILPPIYKSAYNGLIRFFLLIGSRQFCTISRTPEILYLYCGMCVYPYSQHSGV